MARAIYGNKYFNVPKTVNGKRFQSTKEANRYQELLLLQRAGAISKLQTQVNYLLIPAAYDDDGKKIEGTCSYRADFVYWQDGQLVVEDVKGYKKGAAYDLFKIKRKLMLKEYGIRIKEV